MSTKAQKADQEQAKATLREWLKPGMTIYCVLKHVSRSGMQREISLHYIEQTERGPEIRWLSGVAARAMGDRIGKRDGIIIDGAGMDMGFALVDSLSWTVYPAETRAGRGLPVFQHRWI